MALVTAVTKLFNKHQGELLAFFTTAMTSDTVAPAAGVHRLADHFASLVAAGREERNMRKEAISSGRSS